MGYPAYATHGTLVPLILIGAWGLAFCIGGHALRRHQWGVRWWGAGLCVSSISALPLTGIKISLLGIVLNLLALGIIIATWQQLAAAIGANKSPGQTS